MSGGAYKYDVISVIMLCYMAKEILLGGPDFTR